MPIPSPRYRPSNLNTQQQADQLAAVYGVDMSNQFSPEEVERMRQIVMGYDQQKPVETIDLNNPKPKPYHFQKFPKMVYALDHAGKHLIVKSEDELEQAIAEGWSEEAPVFTPIEEPYLSPALQRDADAKQAEIDAIKRERMAAARAAKASKAAHV